MQIIDSHVHFWQPERLRYRWHDATPALNRPYLPADLQSASESFDLQGVVFVQADCLPEQSLAEAQWVSQLDSAIPILGIVAAAPLEKGETSRELLAIMQENPRIKGIRRLIQSEAAGFSVQRAFVHAVQLLPKYGFSFDICIYHHQLPDVLRLVKQCPNVSFVLDHIAKPDIANGKISGWKENIQALAQHDNVWCKLSGMVTEADHEHWTIDDLRPYVEHTLACFGIERVMFGSDWPVSTLAATYAGWLETLMTLVEDYSDDEKEALFFENAKEFYRLNL